MLVGFLQHLKNAHVKVSITEWLDLVDLMARDLIPTTLDDFYLLARTALVKDESQYDRFDRAFADFFKGIRALPDPFPETLPEDWLNNALLNQLTDEEKAQLEALGGLDKLLETLKQRLEEQKERHEGGSKWIGTGGTSPFGHSGYNPEGIRIGGPGRHGKALKVWEQRQYKNLDDQLELGTRNLKVALRALRRFARTGSSEELDLEDTIASTARNAGLLDVKLRPERHNAVKVLLLLDVGGSMDYHVRASEELFSACKSEFKHLETYYFHNFIYDHLWQDNRLQRESVIPLFDLLHKYGSDYKVIIVGDAAMSPYEILSAYGSIDFINEQPGSYWFKKVTDHFSKVAWLNPTPQEQWKWVQSIGIIEELIESRMFPLTVQGLQSAIKIL
ncbi:VWA domain-containing protein [Reinekea sp. G2M2-21]|uniref:vWA domain-containing protein n=1 Tax=Reinekea sp. G2M2-21 TaxID=2788942 RepID=UPI0018AB6B02|nr:VWA domain-containing protein [Reinekea sp. G2M2-21]